MKHIIPNIQDWPIYKLSERRQQFIQEINTATFQKLNRLSTEQLKDMVERTLYSESSRVKNDPWEVDPPNEALFWNKLKRRLEEEVGTSPNHIEYRVLLEEILRTIINRYSQEIVGSFKMKTFLFARKFLTVFFNVIFNPLRGKHLLSFWTSINYAKEKIRVIGPLDTIRQLAKEQILVLTPTHSSNLDSILIGYMLDMKTGLPGFSYGAGLNLYNSGIAAYFMNRLGAYRVDRRKKNLIYLETLKIMSHLSIVLGTNSLFFPGGTRSRSNHLEKNLKLGLLSTAVDAQRTLCEKKEEKKIIIVPLILSNHFVFEARSLVEQHLRQLGKEKYSRSKDTSRGFWNGLKFITSFFKVDTEAVFSMGQPMDVFGNPVNVEGKSMDHRGHEIDISGYFRINENIVTDPQRESEYTKILADHIAEKYYREHVVLDSNMVAFVAFQYLLNRFEALDLFGVLKLNPKTLVFNESALVEGISQLKSLLIQKTKEGSILLDKHIEKQDPEEILLNGMKKLGVYHRNRPLIKNKKGLILSKDLKLLYFYHNKLDNYGLQDELYWKKILSFERPEVQLED